MWYIHTYVYYIRMYAHIYTRNTHTYIIYSERVVEFRFRNTKLRTLETCDSKFARLRDRATESRKRFRVVRG